MIIASLICLRVSRSLVFGFVAVHLHRKMFVVSVFNGFLLLIDKNVLVNSKRLII